VRNRRGHETEDQTTALDNVAKNLAALASLVADLTASQAQG
jgi:hypothetical protein